LVPVGQPELMATALRRTLDDPPDRAALQARAAAFDLESTASAYLEVLRGRSGAA